MRVHQNLPGVFPAGDIRPRLLAVSHEVNVAGRQARLQRFGPDKERVAIAAQGQAHRVRRHAVTLNAAHHLHGSRADDIVRATDHHLRRVDPVEALRLRVAFLPGSECGRGETVFPADVIPVIHMKRERDDRVMRAELGQKRIGGRAGGAALRGEQLHHHRVALLGRRCGRREQHRHPGQNPAHPVDHPLSHDPGMYPSAPEIPIKVLRLCVTRAGAGRLGVFGGILHTMAYQIAAPPLIGPLPWGRTG